MSHKVDPVHLFMNGDMSLLSDVHNMQRLEKLEIENENLKDRIRFLAERLRQALADNELEELNITADEG